MESHKNLTNTFSYTTQQLYKHKLYNPKITQLYTIGLNFINDPSYFLILNTKQSLVNENVFGKGFFLIVSLNYFKPMVDGLFGTLALIYVFQGEG